MQKVGRLELTWVGKYEEDRFEPRILIEDKEKSYGDASSDNMLIHGDNLLALKALERDYTGKIRCIYIDPPYNTGNAFEHYDDDLEHSIWLATVYKGNIIKNLIMDCQSYTKYRPNETTGGIFVSWRRKEELPTGA